jgi:hypothetical protein
LFLLSKKPISISYFVCISKHNKAADISSVNMACCVINCKLKETVKFKPKTEEQLIKWKDAISYRHGNISSINSFRICHRHFSERQYERDLMHELTGNRKKLKLLPSAVPDQMLSELPTTGTLSAINTVPPVHFSKVKEDRQMGS